MLPSRDHVNRSALSGQHLSIAAEVWPPWYNQELSENGSIVRSGIMWETLLFLSRSLNFTFTIRRPKDGKWGIKDSQGQWNGMLGMVNRQEVDLALGPFAVIFEREQACDFSNPLFIDTWTTIAPANLAPDPESLIHPFERQVWVALLIWIPIFIACLSLADWFYMGRKGLFTKILPASVGFTVRALLESSSPWVPKDRLYNRILALFWLLGMFVLSQSYSGNLISILTVPDLPTPIDGVEDLVAQTKLPWAIESGSILEHMGVAPPLATLPSPTFKRLYDGALLKKSCYDSKSDIRSGSYAFVCERVGIDKVISDDFSDTGKCHYYVGSQDFLVTSFAMAFPKNSSYLRDVNKWIQVLLQIGLEKRWFSRLMPNASSCDTQTKIVKSHGAGAVSGLQIAHTLGLFLVLVLGWTVATLAFIGERLLLPRGRAKRSSSSECFRFGRRTYKSSVIKLT